MAPAPINGQDPTTQQRRRVLRYSVEAPLDVTILRSGIPDTVPGRSLNLGAGGLAAMLAAELSPGESVGVEIRLPEPHAPLSTRAQVRHHDKLRYGMEFIGLSADQQATIRNLTEKNLAGKSSSAEAIKREPTKREEKAAPDGKTPKPRKDSSVGNQPPNKATSPIRNNIASPAKNSARTERPSEPESSENPGIPPGRLSPKKWNTGWLFLFFSAAVLLSVLWWRWDRGWAELESGLHNNEAAPQVEAQISADVMEKLVRHRVDPDYPAAARPQNLQAVVVLDVVVNRDGSVADVRPIRGPQILAQAAVDALRWWRFDPSRVDGKPVVAETTVAVEFKP
jgi:TonB family protein